MNAICTEGNEGNRGGVFLRCLCFLLFILPALASAGQQTLWWDVPPGAVATYEFRFSTNSGGPAVQTRTVAAGSNSAVFTLPAGRWYVRAVSLTASNGVSDPSNEAVFDIPQPITIRLNLSSAPSPEGPWRDETNSPPLAVAVTDPARFYRARVEIQR